MGRGPRGGPSHRVRLTAKIWPRSTLRGGAGPFLTWRSVPVEIRSVDGVFLSLDRVTSQLRGSPADICMYRVGSAVGRSGLIVARPGDGPLRGSQPSQGQPRPTRRHPPHSPGQKRSGNTPTCMGRSRLRLPSPNGNARTELSAPHHPRPIRGPAEGLSRTRRYQLTPVGEALAKTISNPCQYAAKTWMCLTHLLT